MTTSPEKGDNKNKWSFSTIKTMVEHNIVDAIDRIIMHQSDDLCKENNQLICCAADYGYWHMVTTLMKSKKVDPAARDNHVMKCIIEQVLKKRVEHNSYKYKVGGNYGEDYIRCLMMIINDPRVDVTIGDNAAFRFAAKNGHTAFITGLLENKAVDPFTNNDQAMVWAIENNQKEVVNQLLCFNQNSAEVEGDSDYSSDMYDSDGYETGS